MADGRAMEKRNAELERAIEANPDDTDAFSVLADWLQANGEPRGELMALMLAGKTAQAAQLIADKADYFLGPLAEHTRTREHDARDAFTWRLGFIHAARLSYDTYATNDRFAQADVLEALFAHPSGRYLRELSFGFNGDPNEDSLQSLIDVIAREARPTLRKVHFGDYRFAGGGAVGMYGNDTEISWYSVGNLSKVWQALPAVETVIVQGGSAESAINGGVNLGTIELPALRHLEIRSGGLDVDNARAALMATAPALEHLEVWFGMDMYGGDAAASDVEPLLARTDLPKLRRLGLRNAMFTDELPELLANSPLLRQLAALDLSLGTLTDEGASVIARHRDAFAHLELLDVSQCCLSEAGAAQLHGIAKTLVIGEQREDDGPEDRYTAIGE